MDWHSYTCKWNNAYMSCVFSCRNCHSYKCKWNNSSMIWHIYNCKWNNSSMICLFASMIWHSYTCKWNNSSMSCFIAWIIWCVYNYKQDNSQIRSAYIGIKRLENRNRAEKQCHTPFLRSVSLLFLLLLAIFQQHFSACLAPIGMDGTGRLKGIVLFNGFFQ